MSVTPDFGVPIPQVFLDGRADMELVRTTLQRSEELGFHSAWVQDQIAGDTPLLEAMSLLAYASAVTERMKLGVSVIVLPIRNAPQLAKCVSSIDHMSNGRVILGVGLGPVFAGDRYFRIFGTSAGEALARFNEGVEVMKRFWTEQKIEHDGRFYRMWGADMEPKPVQKPHPPLWFGGQHPDALRRAVRVADGFMGAGPTTTADFARNVQMLREFMTEAGRDPATLPISKRVYLAVDRDTARAKRRLDEFFARRYPWQVEANTNYVADTCVWGTPQQVIDGLAEVLSAGAGMIVLNPLWDFVEQLETLASDVVPALKKSS
ncbi:MAG: LLM class flavin-dependent oxidoreductase [Gammaproteobacteria bacterium]|nr:LLM class flavin-dependent oxidoreductase [Gammaproteobacteria bacterium]